LYADFNVNTVLSTIQAILFILHTIANEVNNNEFLLKSWAPMHHIAAQQTP